MLSLNTVTPREYDIVMLVRAIEYGELLEVDTISPETGSRPIKLTWAETKLLEQCRDHLFIDKIVMHQGLPTYVEVSGETAGIRYRRKIKL